MRRPLRFHRGDVWLVDFDPPQGAEIGKTRPAVIMNVEEIGRLPLAIVVPITDWKPRYANYPWFVHLSPSSANGLSKESGADGFQVKSLSERRLQQQLGTLSAQEVEDIAASIALCIGFIP